MEPDKIITSIGTIIATVVSLYTLWKNRTTLKVHWSQIEMTMDNSVVVMKSKNKAITSYKNTFLTSITVINSSPNDVGYYDLRVYDAETGKPLEIAYLAYFLLEDKESYVLHYINAITSNLLNVPKKDYGIFRSNSYNRLDLPIVVTDEYEYKDLRKIQIEFKVAKNYFNKEKVYSFQYNVTGWQNLPYKDGYGLDIQVNLIALSIIEMKVKDRIIDKQELFSKLDKMKAVLNKINNSNPENRISIVTLREVSDVFDFFIENEVKHDQRLVNELNNIKQEILKNKVCDDDASVKYINKIDEDLKYLGKVWY